MKKITIILLVIIPVSYGAVWAVRRPDNQPANQSQQGFSDPSSTPQPNKKSVANSSKENQPRSKPTISSAAAPLPTGKDVLLNFFSQIDAGEVEAAMSFLSSKFIANENSKQNVGVLLNSFTAFKTQAVTAFNPDKWTDSQQKYEVLVNAAIAPNQEDWVLQKYGWVSGENRRWITLVKEDDLWKVSVMATAP